MKKFAYIQTVDGAISYPNIFDTKENAEACMIIDFFDHSDLSGLSRHCYNGEGDGIDIEAAHKMYHVYMDLRLNDGVANIHLGSTPIANAIGEDECKWKGVVYSIEV